MADTLYCPYCASTNLVPYMVKYWWCNNCNRFVYKPVIVQEKMKAVGPPDAQPEA